MGYGTTGLSYRNRGGEKRRVHLNISSRKMQRRGGGERERERSVVHGMHMCVCARVRALKKAVASVDLATCDGVKVYRHFVARFIVVITVAVRGCLLECNGKYTFF